MRPGTNELPPTRIFTSTPVPNCADGDGVSGGTLLDERGIVSGIPHCFRRMSKERKGMTSERKEGMDFPNVFYLFTQKQSQCAQPLVVYRGKRFLGRGEKDDQDVLPLFSPCSYSMRGKKN